MKNKLKELIMKYCPDGVEYKKLGEIAAISRGGSFQKKDFCETGVPCIHYGQIYTRYGMFAAETFTFIPESIAPKQKYAQPGDIVMAVTSENIEDVCKCVAWLGSENAAISGHTAIIHHNQNPKYLSYFFHSTHFQNQKLKYIHGTKVMEVTPSKLVDIFVPVPPLPVQEEIVRILDAFTELTAELTAELDARKKQYEYYQCELFNQPTSKIIALRDCCVSIADGDHQAPPKTNEGIPFVTISNIHNNRIDFSDVKYVPVNYFEKLDNKRIPEPGDILYSVVGSFGIPVYIDDTKPFAFQRHIAIVRPNSQIIQPRYLYHLMKSKWFFKQAENCALGAAQKTITLSSLNKMKVLLPPLAEQERIVSILDRFDALCNDLTSGLPAEIEARKKQYEYYRDKLLTFKELK